MAPDATAPDATAPDARAPDVGIADVQAGDAVVVDIGFPDAGFIDAAPVDTGVLDAGPTDATPRGTCQSAADCAGQPCLAVPNAPNGWHTCAVQRVEATMCTGGPDQCCDSTMCTAGQGGGCFLGPIFFCGGAHPIPSNMCVYDGCSTDADCSAMPFGVCVPPGAFGEYRSVCDYGDCRFDSDCSGGPAGECSPFFDPCNGRFIGFHCTYFTSACRSDSDCPSGYYCQPGMGGNTSCQKFTPPP
jgi:hypothetical protein